MGEGQGVKHSSSPASLSVLTSTGLLTQSVSQKGTMTLLAGDQKKKKGKILTFLVFSFLV